MKGVVPIHICGLLEHVTGKRIPEIFDLVVGTSTGSLIAYAYALKEDLNATTLLDLYEDLGKNVFTSNSWFYFVRNFHWYNSENLARSIEAEFGEDPFKLSSVSKWHIFDGHHGVPYVRSAAVSNFLDAGFMSYKPLLFRLYPNPYSEGEKCFYHSIEEVKDVDPNDVFVTDALLASCAAPTVFKTHKIGDTDFVDGGIGYNNPTYLAYWEAKKLFPQENFNYNIISLGTGRPNEELLEDAKSSMLAKQKFDIFYNTLSQVDVTHKQMKLLQNSHEGVDYVRMNPSLNKDIKLTSTEEEDMEYLGELVRQFMVTKEGITGILLFLNSYRKRCIKRKESVKRLDYFIENLEDALEVYEKIEHSPYYYSKEEKMEKNMKRVLGILYGDLPDDFLNE